MGPFSFSNEEKAICFGRYIAAPRPGFKTDATVSVKKPGLGRGAALAPKREQSHHSLPIARKCEIRLNDESIDPNFPIRFPSPPETAVVGFDRRELQAIFNIYGRMVAQGVWRDYAIDFSSTRAIFSIFCRTGEAAFYRIVKEPKSARKQGAYSIVMQTGLILKRGQELPGVLAALEKPPRLVAL